MKIFGDDGFRDKVKKNLLSEDFLNKFFLSLNSVLNLKKINNIIVGFDTRHNNQYIFNIIKKNINNGKKIFFLKNPISTPGLQFLSKNNFCIMVTASHFPHNYNGFKFFFDGSKINKKFEKLIVKNLKKKHYKDKKFNTIKYIDSTKYINFLNKKFNFKIKKNIVIDCSFGSVASFYNKINFFKNLKVINTDYKKNKINNNCGTNYLSKNINKYDYKKYDFCIAFDGDADRVLISEKTYGVIEPEKLAFIFIKFFQKKIRINSIVGTKISNPWLKEILNKENIKFYLSNVGDRNVINLKKKKNSFFGFETSGHFCFNETMDGIYASGLFLKILKEKPDIIYESLNLKIIYFKSVFGVKKNYFTKFKIYKKRIKNKDIKIVSRKSIWNDFYKVYIFYKSRNKILIKLLNYLANKVVKQKFKN